MKGMLLAVVLTLGAPPAQDATFRISGTVVREDNQDPAQAAQSNQIRLSGPSTLIIPVGPGGAFEFPNVRPGNYQLVVGPRITMTPVAVTVADKDVTGVRLVVPPIPGVTGNVTVEGGGPRPRFQLAFTRIDSTASPLVAIAAPAFNIVPPAGQYRISVSGLPAGYSLKSITMGNVDALAQPLTVTQGSSHLLSITLGVSSPPPWVRVSGRVTGGRATQVTLTGTAAGEPLTAVVGADGAFEFPRVISGDYSARTIPAATVTTPIPVTVGSTDMSNVEIRIPATKEVTGRITLRGNVPVPRLTFSLAVPGAAANVGGTTLSVVGGVVVTTVAGGVNVPANPQADGTFKVTLPEGVRTITIVGTTIPAGYVVDAFTYGSTDLLAGPLRVGLNDTAELSIVLDATQVKPVKVSGRVDGLLTTHGVRVVMTGGNLGPGVESPVAPDGSFAFSDIPPGNYQARLSLSGLVISSAVRVDNRDVTGVVITHPRRFAVAAHVLVDGDTGTAAMPGITLDARSPAGVVVTSSTIVSGNGPMVLTLPDGEHTIGLRTVPAGYQLKSIRYGTSDLQKEPLKIDGPITWEIIVRLAKM